jgi:alcohol dehydrogenase class IV
VHRRSWLSWLRDTGKRVVLVTDSGVRTAGLYEMPRRVWSRAAALTVFDDVEADPLSHVIERACTLS